MGRPFGVISISDGDGSMASAMPSMNTGDVAIICLNTKELLGNVGERVPVEIRMYPEIGNAAIMRGSTTSTIVGNVMELL
jgi:archaellin